MNFGYVLLVQYYIEVRYLSEAVVTEYKLREIGNEPPVWIAKAEWFHKYYDVADAEKQVILKDIVQKAEREFLAYAREHPNSYIACLKFNTFEEKLEACKQLGNWDSDRFNGRYAFLYTKKPELNINCIILRVFHQHSFGYKAFNLFIVYAKDFFVKKKPFCDNGKELRNLHDRLKQLNPAWDLKLHLLYKEREDNSVWHERKKFYTDMETGEKWVWTYKTTPGYSREDGWWYEEPRII